MTAEASGAGAPKCKICGNNHWLRVGCDGQQFATNNPQPRAMKGSGGERQVPEPSNSRAQAAATRRPGVAGDQGTTPAKRKRAKKRKAKRGGKK